MKVNQTGGSSFPGTDVGWSQEISLDVEWAHALAPGAGILLVEANNSDSNNLLAAVQFARTQANVSVVSMSWGTPEAFGETGNDSIFRTPSGHTGITFLASTGDTGQPGTYPAFSPNVVAVGATQLTLDGSSNYASEIGWNESGGGISKQEGKPGYQSSVTQSASHRTIPDVAFNGSTSSGVSILDSFAEGASTPWIGVAGTSFSVLGWAAMVAIADQGRVFRGLSTLDGATQTLPMLYQFSNSDFHDITSGNNGTDAGAGYDLVTGLGTPVANRMVGDLVGGFSVSGTVFSDNNGNTTFDSGESGLARVTVYIDLNNDKSLEANEPHDITDSSGNYVITGLLPSNPNANPPYYVVRRIFPAATARHSPPAGSGSTRRLAMPISREQTSAINHPAPYRHSSLSQAKFSMTPAGMPGLMPAKSASPASPSMLI